MKKQIFFFIFLLLTTFLSLKSDENSLITIFAHGIVDGPSQIQRFKEALCTDINKAVCFPDAQNLSDSILNTIIYKMSFLFGLGQKLLSRETTLRINLAMTYSSGYLFDNTRSLIINRKLK